MKIVIITNIPSPYRIPLFNRIHNNFISKGWRLSVIFLTRTYERRKWEVNENEFEFEFEYLNDPYLALGEGITSLSPSLLSRLHLQKPSAIIVGGFTIPTVWVYLFSRMNDIPYYIWSGETLEQSIKRFDILHLRYTLRKFLARAASGGIVYGSQANAYLKNIGMNPESIVTAINTVDTDFFTNTTQAVKKGKKATLQQLKYPEINILYVGNLTKQKGVQCFLRACSIIKNNLSDVGIHIVGDGDYKEYLMQLSRRLDLKNVFFHGFKQKKELSLYYGICDLFVFPSFYDVWGLVCIEAMSAGLPVIGSLHAGVIDDLVIDGYNGFRIDPIDEIGFSERIGLLIRDPQVLQSFSVHAMETVKTKFTIALSADGFNRTAEHVIGLVD